MPLKEIIAAINKLNAVEQHRLKEFFIKSLSLSVLEHFRFKSDGTECSRGLYHIQM